MNTCFKINSKYFTYYRGNENRAFENERSVEIPLGQWFINKFGGKDIVEVGCVMPWHGMDDHTIYDLTDVHPKNIKANALTLDYVDKNVLCLSTIEHFRKAEYGNQSDEDAIKMLHLIIDNAANWLITFPPTYHTVLDKYLINNPSISRTVLKRINWQNEWEVDHTGSFNYLFGHRDGRFPDGLFNNANAVCIITNQIELL